VNLQAGGKIGEMNFLYMRKNHMTTNAAFEDFISKTFPQLARIP